MATLITQSRPSSLRSGVYIHLVKPIQQAGPTPSGRVGVVFKAPKGPANTALSIASMSDFVDTFGGEVLDIALSTPGQPIPLSGYTSINAIKAQGAYDVVGVRVLDSTGATAYVTLKDANGAAILAFHAASPGTWASGLSVTPRPNTANPALFDLIVSDAATGQTDTIAGLDPTDNAGTIRRVSAGTQLGFATRPVLDVPTGATVAVGTGGALAAGGYTFIVAGTTAAGETTGSPEAAVVQVPANGQVSLTPTGLGPLAVGYKVFGTAPNGSSGSETFAGVGVAGQPLVLSAPWPASGTTPSLVNTATTGPGSTNAPAFAPMLFASTRGAGLGVGSDGANAGATAHIGAPAGDGPATGVNLFATLGQKPNIVLLAEDAGSDPAGWAAQAQLAYGNQWEAVAAIPRGTPPAALPALVQQAAALKASPQGGFFSLEYNGYILDNDPVTGGEVWVSSASVCAGLTAVQDPEASAANQPVAVGHGFAPVRLEYDLSDSQVEQITALSINCHTAHIPVGGYGKEKDWTFGLDFTGSGRGSALRMGNLVMRGMAAANAQFVEEPITPDLYQNAVDVGMSYLGQLALFGHIPANDPGSGTAAAQTTTTATAAATTRRKAVPATTSAAPVQTATPRQNYSVTCDTTIQDTSDPYQVRERVAVAFFGIAEQFVVDYLPSVGAFAPVNQPGVVA